MKGQRTRHVVRSIRHVASARVINRNQGRRHTRQGSFAALPIVDHHSESPSPHGLINAWSVNRSSTPDLPNSEPTFWLNGGALFSNTSAILRCKPPCASDYTTVRGSESAGNSCKSEVFSLLTASQLSGNAFRVPFVFFSTAREQVVTEDPNSVHGSDEPVFKAVRCKEPERSDEQPATENGLELDHNRCSKAESSGRHESGCETSQVPKEWSDLGWTRDEVLNWPNAVSMARLVSGPFLSWMIVQGYLGSACVGLVVAGISDWLDGFLARKLNIKTLLGSYLDPVADKILVGSVALSMMYAGLLHRKQHAASIGLQEALWLLLYLPTVLICILAAALVGLIVARDGGLMTGTIVYRAYSLGWQWNDWREIFRIDSEGAAKVEPLLISKFNTVLQLALVGVALLQPALSMEDVYSLVPILSWSVVATTSMSGIAYAYMFFKDPSNLLALRQAARVPGRKVSRASPAAHVK